MKHITFDAKGKRSAAGHPAGHVRIVSHGEFLHSYASVWLEHMDDPTCWSSKPEEALWLSPADAALIVENGVCGFQTDVQVQS